MGDVWYRDGLRFECTRCGNCCTGAPGYVWLDDAEIDALAAAVGLPREQFVAIHTRRAPRGVSLREKPNGDCVFYDRVRGCTVYEQRPKQCRTWPFWESHLESPRSWERVQRECPGVDRGDWIPVEEITRRMNEIPL